MIQVKTNGSFAIKGRGLVFTASAGDNPGVKLTDLNGKLIQVDDCFYRVTGLELSQKNGVVDSTVGLVVRPVDQHNGCAIEPQHREVPIYFGVSKEDEGYQNDFVLVTFPDDTWIRCANSWEARKYIDNPERTQGRL